MKEKLEVARGSGNVFRDLGQENADAEQFKAILAAEIIRTLDRALRAGERLTVRAAHDRTGIAAADLCPGFAARQPQCFRSDPRATSSRHNRRYRKQHGTDMSRLFSRTSRH